MIVSYVICNRPKDYPEKFTVRRWVGETPDQELVAAVDTLEQARAAIPEGCTNFGRIEEHDPVIDEVWIAPVMRPIMVFACKRGKR